MNKMAKKALVLVAWFSFWIVFNALWPSYVLAAQSEEQAEASQEGRDTAGDAMLLMLLEMFEEGGEEPWVDTGMSYDEQNQQLQDLESLFDNPENIPATAVQHQQDAAEGNNDSSYIYDTAHESANNPTLLGINNSENFVDDMVFAQTHGAYSSETNPNLSDILTGCVTETTTEEGETETYFNSDVQACTQSRKLDTGQCDATRAATFTPVEVKTVVEIFVKDVADSGGSQTCPGVGEYDQCIVKAEADYQSCRTSNSCGDWATPPEACYECDLDFVLAKNQCRNLCPGITGITGTFTLTGESFGEQVMESDVPLLNGTVDIKKTPFHVSWVDNLPANEFFVAGYVVTVQNGSGDLQVITLGNSQNLWEYELEITLDNASGITVDAVIFQIEEDGFQSESCTESQVLSMVDGLCQGTATCTNATPCQVIDGVEICSDGYSSGVLDLLIGWGNTGLEQGCWSADLDITQCNTNYSCEDEGNCGCEGLEGEEYQQCIQDSCWIDVNGDLICPESNSPRDDWENNLGDEGWVDDCEDQIANEQCQLLEDRPCDADSEGASGECYERHVFFECGEEVEFERPVSGVDQDTTCDSDIQCFGDECNRLEDENNEDFEEAMIAASVVNWAQGETECPDPTNPETCKIFVGTDEWCKQPRGHFDDIGIIPNCCEMARDMAAQFSDMSLYFQLIMVGNRMELWQTAGTAIAETGAGQAVGEWMEPVVDGASSVLDTFGISGSGGAEGSSSLFGSIFGTDVEGSAFSGVGQFVADMLYNALPQDMANSLFSTVNGQVTGWGTGALGQTAAFIAQALSVIMWVYMIYQFLKILANLIPGFKCEDEELQFGQKLVTKSCHFVGKKCAKKIRLGPFLEECVSDKMVYCCYQSPLARIINEQIKGISVPPDERSSYRGEEWGTVDEPSCGGITIAELKEIDWEQIDFSEWYAIMAEAGLIPDPDEFDAPRSWESSNVYIDDEPPEGYEWDNDIDQNLDNLEDVVGDMNDGEQCNPMTGENCEPVDTGGGDTGGGDTGGGDTGGGDTGGGDTGGGDTGGGDTGGGDTGGGEEPPPEPVCDPDNGEMEGCFEEPVCDLENGSFTGCAIH